MRFGAWLPANYRAIDAGRVVGALHAAVSGAPGVQVLLRGGCRNGAIRRWTQAEKA
jgi:hypothetical protein